MTEQEIKDLVIKGIECLQVNIDDMPYGVDIVEPQNKSVIDTLAHELYTKLNPPMPDVREAVAIWIHQRDYVNHMSAYDVWAKLNRNSKRPYLEEADSILSILREHGMVWLDEDQTLPELNELRGYIEQGYAEKMIEAGFRRVKP